MIQTAPIASGVRHLEITPEYAGQRLDNFLLRELKGAPKSLIYRILRRGEVRLNGGRVQPSQRLQVGDQLRIPPVRLSERQVLSPPSRLVARLQEVVIYEDRQVLVLDKPAGLAVHKGSGVDYGIIELVRALRPDEPFLELAHRLDRETSGCLILARTAEALRLLHESFRRRLIEKHYLALVRGHWNHGVKEIDLPLQRNVLRGGERMVEVTDDGKPARTRLRPISLYPQASLLEVAIATGRTHQIRVHSTAIDHPLAGDDKYGDPVFNRLMAEKYGLRRLFLHAHRVTMRLAGREIAVDTPLAGELKAVVDALGAQQTPHRRGL